MSPSWWSATARWARGRRCATSSPARAARRAGCTRSPASWTRSPSAYSRRPRSCCTRSWRHPRSATPARHASASAPSSMPGTPEAVAKLDNDWAHLTAFYDFPAEHWRHLRTSNAIESSFATVKLRTRVTKGAGSKKAALAMAYKLLDAAQERWRRFNGNDLVADVLAGAQFKDGIRVTDDHTTTTNEKVAA